MTIPLTSETLAAAWDYVCSMPPLSEWNLPASDEISFRVIRTKKVYGQLSYNKKYVIEISAAKCGRHETILSTLCHEAAHMHQHSACFMNRRNAHDAAFWALADQVCAIHEFDRKLF
jgi:hypothetical protein